jgi:hypothetical protein
MGRDFLRPIISFVNHYLTDKTTSNNSADILISLINKITLQISDNCSKAEQSDKKTLKVAS